MFHIRHDASLARSIHHCHTFYAPPFGGISFSSMLLLVRCHQLHATTQQTQREERYIRFSFVFILCHLSLSSIITITYSLSINPSHVDAEAKSNAPSLSLPASATSMRNFYFYLFSSASSFFVPTVFTARTFASSLHFFISSLVVFLVPANNLYWCRMSLSLSVLFCCWMCMVVVRAWRCSTSFDSSIAHASVIQFIYCLSTPQRNWIRVNRLNSYCFIIFVQKLSIIRHRKEHSAIRSLCFVVSRSSVNASCDRL